jgi:hypothetical protein
MPEPLRNPPPKSLSFGPCPKCNEPLRLALIEPDQADREKRMYECIACGRLLIPAARVTDGLTGIA